MNVKSTAFFVCLAVFLLGINLNLKAQDVEGCQAPELMGCSDYGNTGYYSDDPKTLEYDNVVSGYHASAARISDDGTWQVWGRASMPNGSGNYAVPTTINPGNFSTTNGANTSFPAGTKVLKMGIGSQGSLSSYNSILHQFILLTDKGELWVWGNTGTVVSTGLVNGSSFRRFTPNGSNPAANGNPSLPVGVTAANVRMMFVTNKTIAITTCYDEESKTGGDVWVLSQVANIRNNQGNANTWIRIRKSGGTNDYLTGVIATRGSASGLIALAVDASGNQSLWTWGNNTFLGTTGSSNGLANRQWATQMTLPQSTGTIKMIGATNSYTNNQMSYFVLYQGAEGEGGSLYSMGANNNRQLGDFTTTTRTSWVQPRYTNNASNLMNDIQYIAPQSTDNLLPYVNVININKELWNFGAESRNMMGRNTGSGTGVSYVNPGRPTQWEDLCTEGGNSIVGPDHAHGDESVIFVASGGHTTVLLKSYGNTFGYIGHRVHGSMGDNTPNVDQGDNVVHFRTNQISVCGLNNKTKITISPNKTEYCTSDVVTAIATLNGVPVAGGTYRIQDGDPATIDPNTGVIHFTGAGSVRVFFAMPDYECGHDIEAVLEVKNCNLGSLRIDGNVWDDGNGDAIIDSGEPGEGNGMWANFMDPSDNVMISTKIDDGNGTYSFTVPNTVLGSAWTGTGNFKVLLTNSSKTSGTNLTEGNIPGNDFVYTGTNDGSAGSEATGVGDKKGVFVLSGLTPPVGNTFEIYEKNPNFGINQRPTVVEKSFNVGDIFSDQTPPTGFPTVSDGATNFVWVKMSDPALGSLTGHDREDCPTPAVCETGATFKVISVKPNTRLYYDDDVVEIVAGDVIPAFDYNNMVIYGAVGSGDAADPIGFTYAMIDKGGAESTTPEKYEIISEKPLPVGLLSFNAVKNGNRVDLKWTTGTEDVNKGFSVERSTDGEHWSEIGFVNSKASGGNSNTNLDYDYADNNPVSGNNYYRLKQISLDGRTSYSDVRVVKFTRDLEITLYPNPARSDVNVSGLAGNENLRVYDATGRLVLESKASSNNAKLNVSTLSNGMYILRVVSADGSVTTKKFEKRK